MESMDINALGKSLGSDLGSKYSELCKLSNIWMVLERFWNQRDNYMLEVIEVAHPLLQSYYFLDVSNLYPTLYFRIFERDFLTC